MGQPMRCGRCGEVIGIYEPVVLLIHGSARTTSAAAEPRVGDKPGPHFHRACYADSPAVLPAQ
jgi:hypothetical protein